MKILTLHCDYIKFKALKKAVKNIDDTEAIKEAEVKEPLVVLTAVEKGDTESTIQDLIQSIEKTSKDVNTRTIVLYPYAHLSSNLASPSQALEFLQKAESLLKKEKFNVTRAPFGYYKAFELKVKGHPLSELSKEFKADSSSQETQGNVVVEEKYDPSQLLREISKTKLDTSKLKDNDHRILGQKLDLFSFNEVSPGMVFWHDNGFYIHTKLKEFVTFLLNKYDYKIINTPQILDAKLFKISGHWDHYRKNMFLTKYENRDFGVKPMNCPGAMLIYKTRSRSHKDLPIRFAEFGEDHRQELSGVLAGLFRVIRFTQDDAHIFCTKEQIGDEIAHMLEMIKTVYKDTFGFNYSFELSTRPEKFMGEKKDWDSAEKVLEDVLKKSKAKFKINKGDGAFYGPKIDIHIKDSLGREWQCATIQLDMQMPKRFELSYIGADGKEHTPFVIHRTILGSLERFIGVLLEHLNGVLPLWLSPRQIKVISFTDRNQKACENFVAELKKEIPGIRVKEDYESETVQAKIRNAELMKTNYVVVIGDKEESSKTISVRPHGEKPKFNVNVSNFIEDLKKELSEPYKN
ncbi:threonine--tRNA ligase [Candidatus Pacearchaeota archaeon CG10_big_fil_rev_8_21_14_0_10_34_76]|nr:MAG: threonine--tRNA ligase [Candidatus Pacearchaeota archaeon CG10_big_fil_rev_8_21_14_0_10_34_76]